MGRDSWSEAVVNKGELRGISLLSFALYGLAAGSDEDLPRH
jgi:hypothetical protein